MERVLESYLASRSTIIMNIDGFRVYHLVNTQNTTKTHHNTRAMHIKPAHNVQWTL